MGSSHSRNLNRRKFLEVAGTATAGLALRTRLRALPSQNAGSQQKIRGVMVDAARVPESLAYYRRVIDFCSDWQLNTLQFRLTDDQGSALRFSSVPDLITHPDAFTPDELRELVAYGKKRGVDLLPEVEAFGHTGFITRSPAYKHLLDDDPSGSAEFTGIIPVHPETLPLFEKLFREVASIFPSPWLHGGCDEVNWGGSALSRKALQTKSRPRIWAEYLNQLNAIAHSFGKRFIVWGDLVLDKQPEILAALDKSIVIMDWNYWDSDPAPFRKALDQVREHGAQGIGAPGLISYRWGPRPGTNQLGNIDAFADVYLGSDNSASLGAILTNWVPSRYIQNSLWDGFAYGAVAFNEGTAVARSSAFQRFVERHFGAKWNNSWSEAFKLLYDAAPMYGREAKSTPLGLHLPVPFSDDKMLVAVLKNPPHEQNPFPRLRGLFESLQPSVTKNASDFASLLLSVRYLDSLFWRESVIQQQTASGPLTREAAQTLTREIADRDQALLTTLNNDWDSGRSSKSFARIGPLYGMEPKDQLLFQWQKAAEFSAELAKQPERLLTLLGGLDPA